MSTKLFCGSGGTLMVGESGTSRTMKIHRYYKCAAAKQKKGCTRKSIKKGFIETLVIDYVKKVVFNDDLIGHIADMLLAIESEESTALPLLEKQLSETDKAIENMLNAIQQGIFNQSTKQRLDDLEEQKHGLEIKILQEQIQHNRLSRKQIVFWLRHFRDLDTDVYEHRQRLVSTFINAIYVYDDRILITFNYKDGAKTVSLEDIENSELNRIRGFKRDGVQRRNNSNAVNSNTSGSDLEWLSAPPIGQAHDKNFCRGLDTFLQKQF